MSGGHLQAETRFMQSVAMVAASSAASAVVVDSHESQCRTIDGALQLATHRGDASLYGETVRNSFCRWYAHVLVHETTCKAHSKASIEKGNPLLIGQSQVHRSVVLGAKALKAP